MEEPADFELLTSESIPEISSLAKHYRHRSTGAELLSLENADENKTFGVGFRTVPQDSTGVAHILEHSVLAGSEKYPVKEPFIELVKGSLASYVNASTFEDKTVYPVASQNLQDFYNLIDVYLDSVFHPLLKRTTFEREGWHYTLDEQDGPLGFKGVVFNEMKGQVSNPDYVLFKEIIASLFPDTPYAFSSGGDPAVIPDLTYGAFEQFYHVNYHPSNARFFFYGDDPPAARFERIRPYLAGVSPGQAAPQLEPQPRFEAARSVTSPYPAGAEVGSQKHALSVGWLLRVNDDPQFALAIRILAHILMGAPASPLRKALVESGLGEDVFGSGVDEDFGLFTMLRQLYFVSGLKGVRAENVAPVEGLILDTLQGLAQNGIEQDTIRAALNTVEFDLRENNFGRMPRGLVLFVRALSTWKYGGDPLSPLRFEAPLAQIKERLEAEPRFFERMLQQELLDNPHRVTLHMTPDPQYLDRLAAQEQDRLERAAAGLSAAQREQLVENTHTIQRLQETPDRPEDLAKLPVLALEDLDPQTQPLPLERIEQGEAPIWAHPLPTNGILYADLGFNLHSLPADLLPYLSVFGRALVEMGTGRRGFVELSQLIGYRTGGIEPETFIASQHGSQQAQAWFFLRGKAMIEQSEALFDISRELLLEPAFDQQDRFRQIVMEEKARLEAGLLPAGHAFVSRRIKSAFDEAGWAEEQVEGIESLRFLRRLAERIDADWKSVLEDLQRVHRLLINRPTSLINVTFGEQDWPAIEAHVRGLRAALPEQGADLPGWDPAYLAGNQGLSMPAQVNYVGKGLRVADLPEERQGAMLVASLLLDTGWLWERIRLQGGAYGAWSIYEPLTDYLGFVSYRDPQTLATLKAFDDAAAYLRSLDLDRLELTKSIIGVIGQMDRYMLPDQKGFTSMTRNLAGITDELRQAWRDQVLSTSNEQLRSLSDVLGEVAEHGRVVILGSPAAIDSARAERGQDWMEILPLL